MTGFKHAHVYNSFYLWTKVPCSVCHQIYSLEQCPRGKSRVILEVKEVKPSTKEKKKLKTNSHTKKDRQKKMRLNFQIRNLEISRWNGWIITKSHNNCPQKQAKYSSPKCVDDNNIDIEGPLLRKFDFNVDYKEWSNEKKRSQNLNHLPLFML